MTVKLNKTIYEITNMKTKNSIFKSVFITNKKTFEGYPIIEVEAYDQTFLNATNTVKKFDKTVDRIMKKVYHCFNEEMWLIIYSEQHGKIEILVNDFYMKQYNLI